MAAYWFDLNDLTSNIHKLLMREEAKGFTQGVKHDIVTWNSLSPERMYEIFEGRAFTRVIECQTTGRI